MASHLPMTTFCWLPPERVAAVWPMPEQRTPRRRTASRGDRGLAGGAAEAEAGDARRARGARRCRGSSEARSRPSALRSSVTSAMPRRRAARGEGMATGLAVEADACRRRGPRRRRRGSRGSRCGRSRGGRRCRGPRRRGGRGRRRARTRRQPWRPGTSRVRSRTERTTGPVAAARPARGRRCRGRPWRR